MTNKKLTKEQLQAQISISRSSRIATSVTSSLNTLIKYGGLVLITKYVSEAFVAFAGKETISSFVFNSNLITNLYASPSFVALIGLILGSSGVSYGLAQRNQKRKAIAHLSKRKEELESMLDPGRHSSSLTETGTTRPEDL